MKFFVTGVNGQLGHDVMNELYKRGHEAQIPGIPTYVATMKTAEKPNKY